jgi:hypothetical protein
MQLRSLAICGAVILIATTVTGAAVAQQYKTDIPPAITIPDSVDTRLGTLKFKDGFPDSHGPEGLRQSRLPARRSGLPDGDAGGVSCRAAQVLALLWPRQPDSPDLREADGRAVAVSDGQHREHLHLGLA